MKVENKLSVIIPVKDNAKLVEFLLVPQIKEMVEVGYEIIVVNDGSKDNIKEILKNYPVKLINLDQNMGAAIARNRGVKEATSSNLVFIDSDIEINMAHLNIVYDALERNPNEAFVGLQDDNHSFQKSTSLYENLYMSYNFQQHSNCPIFYTSFAGIRKELFDKFGGFNINYSSSSVEDLELGQRLRNEGIKIRILDDIRLKHYKELNYTQMCRLNYLKGKRIVKVVLKQKKRLFVAGPKWNYMFSIPVSLLIPFLLILILVKKEASFIVTFLLAMVLFQLLNFKFINYLLKSFKPHSFLRAQCYLMTCTFFQGVGIIIGMLSYCFGRKY